MVDLIVTTLMEPLEFTNARLMPAMLAHTIRCTGIHCPARPNSEPAPETSVVDGKDGPDPLRYLFCHQSSALSKSHPIDQTYPQDTA